MAVRVQVPLRVLGEALVSLSCKSFFCLFYDLFLSIRLHPLHTNRLFPLRFKKNLKKLMKRSRKLADVFLIRLRVFYFREGEM